MMLSLLFWAGLFAAAGLAGLQRNGIFQVNAFFWESPGLGERSPTRPCYRTVMQLSRFSVFPLPN